MIQPRLPVGVVTRSHAESALRAETDTTVPAGTEASIEVPVSGPLRKFASNATVAALLAWANPGRARISSAPQSAIRIRIRPDFRASNKPNMIDQSPFDVIDSAAKCTAKPPF